jgi:hypothetical protein
MGVVAFDLWIILLVNHKDANLVPIVDLLLSSIKHLSLRHGTHLVISVTAGGKRHMTSLACLIDVSVVLVVPYFYPFYLYPLLLSLALDF